MKYFMQRLAPLVLLLAILSSCSRFPDQAKIIPDTAGIVVTVDVKSLALKGRLKDVADFKMFKALKKEAQSGNKEFTKMMEGFIENPLSMGIDVFSPVYTFYVDDGSDEKYVGTSIGMSSSGKFLENLESILDELNVDYEHVEGDALDFVILEEETILGWDSDKLLILNPTNIATRENLENIIEDLFELKEEKALIAHENFGVFHDNAKDISLWLTSNIITENRAIKPFVNEIEYDLNDIYLHAFLSFETSDIDFLMNLFPNEELAELQQTQNVWDKEGDNDLVKYCPGNSLLAASLSIDTKALKNLLNDQKNLDGFRKQFKREFGFSLNKAIRAFEGNFVASLYDLEKREIEYTENERVWNPDLYSDAYGTEGGYEITEVTRKREQTMPIMAFICSMKSTSIFEELIEKIPERLVRQKGKHYVIDADGVDFYAGIFKNNLIITNDKKALKQFSDGEIASDNLSKTEMGKSMEKDAFFAFLSLDYEQYPQAFKDEYEENLDQSRQLKTMDKIVGVYDGISIRANVNSFGINVQLKESDENSLATILGNVDKNYKGLISL